MFADITTATLSLKPDAITGITEYELCLSAHGGWGRTNKTTESARAIHTNLSPYNGKCVVTPITGKLQISPIN